MTAINLAAPGNEQLAFETQCQKKAAYWLWRLERSKMTRFEITQRLDAMEEAERERVRYWLNEYRNQV